MSVASIGAATSNSNASSAATATQVSQVSQQDFLNILVTQLAYQDPLKPVDNEQFIAQLAQFTTLAETGQINDKVDTTLNFQAADQAFSLINHTVQVPNQTGTFTVGTVTAVNFVNGAPRLVLTDGNGNVSTGVDPTTVTTVR